MNRQLPWIALVFAALVLSILPGYAQQGAKPIQMIVPYPPGGVDPYARVMMPRLQELLGQTIVIDNRPGANGIIGSREAARAAPDGNTLLFATSSTLVGGIFLIKDVSFNPVTDLAPVTNMF